MKGKDMNSFNEARSSARQTYAGCRWIYDELISSESKRNMRFAIITLLLGVSCLMAIPFTVKLIIDAVSVGERETAMWWLLATLVMSIGSVTFATLHDHFREHAWNRNYFSVHVGLVHKLYRRTLDELIGENSEIGAEQIESLKDRVQNILYLFLFEASLVVATILNANMYMFALDAGMALVLLLLTVMNILWFFHFNVSIDEKMEPIDKAFRRANRRLIEKINFATSVKAGGVEQKTEKEIGEELREPLDQDLQIWAYWFLYVDYVRRLINAAVPPFVVGYGIYFADWSGGTISAMATWSFMISREYGFIGHLMRHLTSQVARIKAAREALSTPPSFDYDEGAIYERSA